MIALWALFGTWSKVVLKPFRPSVNLSNPNRDLVDLYKIFAPLSSNYLQHNLFYKGLAHLVNSNTV
jgi:hypothetical protein